MDEITGMKFSPIFVWLDTPGVIINTPVHKDNAVSSSAMMHIAQDLIFTDQASTR